MDPINNPTPAPNPAPAPSAPPTEPVDHPTSMSVSTPLSTPTPEVVSAPIQAPTSTPISTPEPVSPVASATSAGVTDVSAAPDTLSSPMDASGPVVSTVTPQQPTAPEPVAPVAPVSAGISTDPVNSVSDTALVDPLSRSGDDGNVVEVSGLPVQSEPAQTNSLDPLTTNPLAGGATESTPSVSFADPAEQTESNSMSSGAVSSNKKKSSRTTLIIFVVVAFMVVIALAAVLVFQLTSGEQKSSEVPTPTPVVEKDQDEPDDDGDNGGNNNTDSVQDAIICTANQDVLDNISSQSGQNIKSSTLTLNFSDNKLVGVVMDFTIVSEDGTEISSTDEYTVSQFFEEAGLSKDDLVEQGVELDEDGNVAVSKEQILSVGLDGYTCISPNQS